MTAQKGKGDLGGNGQYFRVVEQEWARVRVMPTLKPLIVTRDNQYRRRNAFWAQCKREDSVYVVVSRGPKYAHVQWDLFCVDHAGLVLAAWARDEVKRLSHEAMLRVGRKGWYTGGSDAGSVYCLAEDAYQLADSFLELAGNPNHWIFEDEWATHHGNAQWLEKRRAS